MYNDLTTKEERLGIVIPAHQSVGEIVDELILDAEKVEKDTCGFDEVRDFIDLNDSQND